MNTNDMTRDELTNSERAAKAVIEDVFAPGPAPKSLIDEAAAIIRREIPGCDDLDALRRRVAVLEAASVELLSVIPSSADCALMVRACQPGGDAAAKTADSLVNQYYKIDPAADRLHAALSASPPSPPDPNAAYVAPNNFKPLIPETHGHDMLIGPCKCGAWHSEADAAALRAGAGGKP